ncbi:MAG: glycosyltransferase family 39 protein [Candidatus Sumerlaeaceae bacterium]|nr:glycosyltransferase family 39 protein [Candidatus Sumerlaeaceae bacterium]
MKKKTRPFPAVTMKADLRIVPPQWMDWCIAHGFWITIGMALVIHLSHLISVRQTDPLYAQPLSGADPETYWKWALSLAGGDWLSMEVTGGKAFYYNPLYAYFLAPFIKIFGARFGPPHLAQALLGACIPLVQWLTARQMFGRGAALATGLLTAACAPLLFYEQMLLGEVLVVFFFSTAIWALVMGCDNERLSSAWFAAAGLATGIASAGRGNGVMLLPIIAVALVAWVRLNRRGPMLNGIKAGAIYLLGAAPPLLLIVWRNHHVAGAWALTTNAGPMFYIGNAHDSMGVFSNPASYDAIMKKYAGSAVPWLGELARSIAGHPLAFLQLLFVKVWLFLNSYDVADNVSYYLYARILPVLRWSPFTWATIVALGVYGIWVTRGDWRRQLVLYAFAVGFMASIVIVLVVGRYRLAFLLPMLIWAGAGVAEIVRGWLRRDSRQLVVAATVILVCGLLLHPWFSASIRRNAPRNAGIREIRMNDYSILANAYANAGRREEGIELLRMGTNEHPWESLLATQMATELNKAGRHTEALGTLREYQKRFPGEARTGYKLAAYLVNDKETTQAKVVLQAVLKAAPQNSEAQRLIKGL